MINHVRTLLLNLNGSSKPSLSYPGEEYVPTNFKAQSLPVELLRIRNILFGVSPDRVMLNYRLRQYMPLLHVSELERWVLNLDQRVTYWPIYDNSLFTAISFGATVSLLSGSPTWNITVTGNPANLKDSNRLLNNWQVTIQDATHVNVTHLQPLNENNTSTYTITSGISNNIPLPGTSLGFRFIPGIQPYPVWQIQSLARPQTEIADAYSSLIQILSGGVDKVFGDITKEPNKTCYGLWSIHNGPIAYKLGTVLLALAYRLNELYTNTYAIT